MNGKWLVTAFLGAVVLVAAGCAPTHNKNMYMHEGMGPVLSGVLDGKTYVGDMTMTGDKTPSQETIVFRDGTFHSIACDLHGFHLAPYLAVTTGDVTTFQAITHDHKGGTMVWNGTVKGDKLEATAKAYMHKQAPMEMTVTATQEKPMMMK